MSHSNQILNRLIYVLLQEAQDMLSSIKNQQLCYQSLEKARELMIRITNCFEDITVNNIPILYPIVCRLQKAKQQLLIVVIAGDAKSAKNSFRNIIYNEFYMHDLTE